MDVPGRRSNALLSPDRGWISERTVGLDLTTLRSVVRGGSMKPSVCWRRCALGLLCLATLPMCSPEPATAWAGDALCDPALDPTGCLPITSHRGVMPTACTRNADCPSGAICPGGYDFCVTPCRHDADCAPPSRCLLDRLEVDFCGCEAGDCGVSEATLRSSLEPQPTTTPAWGRAPRSAPARGRARLAAGLPWLPLRASRAAH
jgi:hypothetical protein